MYNRDYEPDFLLTTASTLEGYRIVKQFGVVFGETLFKHGALKSFGASFSDTIDSLKFGSREMSGTTRLIEDARSFAYEKMIRAAKGRGANAIIAIDSDNTIGGEVMYLSLYGTAVRAVREEDYEKEKAAQKQIDEEEKNRLEKMKEEIIRQKQEMENEIAQQKQEGAGEGTGISSEELFIARMKEEQSLVGIWKIWSIYELGGKYPKIDAYLKMRLDSELQNGKLNNLEKVKEIVEQLINKELAGKNQ